MRSDALGRIILGTDEAPIPTFLLSRSGRVEFCLRADSLADWEREGQAAGILVQDPEDEEGNTPPLRTGLGNIVERISPPLITAATFAADGVTELTAAAYDERPHFDIILEGPALATMAPDNSMPMWELIGLTWMGRGSAITALEQNATEAGMKRSGITLLDPTTFNKRGHRFL